MLCHHKVCLRCYSRPKILRMKLVLWMLTNWRYNMSNIRMCSLSEIAPLRQIPKQWQPLVNSFIRIHWKMLRFRHIYFHCIICVGLFLFLAGQVGVLHRNINKYLNGQSLDANYDGYASCPLVTGYDSCIMAEFDYDLQPKETFPFRQDCERYSMYLLKRDFMPLLYWHLMLNGHWNGPEPLRKLFSHFKFN